MVSLQHFDEDYIGITSVLHIVCHGFGNIATIHGMRIKSPSISLSGVYPDPGLTRYEEIPFVTGGVPVYFPQTAGLNSNQCCRKAAGDGEDCGVNDLDASTRCVVVICFL
jgi:hypothetical protein